MSDLDRVTEIHEPDAVYLRDGRGRWHRKPGRRCHACGVYGPRNVRITYPKYREEWEYHYDEPWRVLQGYTLRCWPDNSAWKRVERAINEWAGLKRITAHHIQPRSRGGSDRKSNLVDLCHRCHMQAHSIYRQFGLCK